MLGSLDAHHATLALALTLAACERIDANRPAQTTTTSASVPRPEATATTTPTNANTGSVDNGAPAPTPPSPPPRDVTEAVEGGRTPPTAPRGSPPLPARRGGPSIETSYRIARARCDRETACNRIGTGRTWGTQDSCVADQRDRVRVDFASLSCVRGIDSVQLGTCLNAMRIRPCDDAGPELDTVSECRSSALCTP